MSAVTCSSACYKALTVTLLEFDDLPSWRVKFFQDVFNPSGGWNKHKKNSFANKWICFHAEKRQQHQLPELRLLKARFWLLASWSVFFFLYRMDSVFFFLPSSLTLETTSTWPCVFQPVFGHTDAGRCPIAASSTRPVIRSRPSPPGSAAHRRLEAERRYSSSPRQRRSGTPGIRARARFPHILTRFLQPQTRSAFKGSRGKVSEERKRKEKTAGECEARWCNHPPSLSHLSPFQSSLFNILRDLKANPESRLLSGGLGGLWAAFPSFWKYSSHICLDSVAFVLVTGADRRRDAVRGLEIIYPFHTNVTHGGNFCLFSV